VKEDTELYLVNRQLSYVDLCLFHLVDGVAFQCPEAFRDLDCPLLKRFHQQIGSRPRIQAYLKEHRQRLPFTGTGPTF